MLLVGEKKERSLLERLLSLHGALMSFLSYTGMRLCAHGERVCGWFTVKQIHETPPVGNSSVAGVGFGPAWSGGRGCGGCTCAAKKQRVGCSAARKTFAFPICRNQI